MRLAVLSRSPADPFPYRNWDVTDGDAGIVQQLHASPGGARASSLLLPLNRCLAPKVSAGPQDSGTRPSLRLSKLARTVSITMGPFRYA